MQKEIEFVNARAKDMSLLTDMLKKGEIPLRVSHNDTKLNNCMFDKNTGKMICVICSNLNFGSATCIPLSFMIY